MGVKMQDDFKFAIANLALLLNKFRRRDLGYSRVAINIAVDEGSWEVGIVGSTLDEQPIDIRGQGWSFPEAWEQFFQLMAETEEQEEAGKIVPFAPKVVAEDGALIEVAEALENATSDEASTP